jgi:hypothetical protein
MLGYHPVHAVFITRQAGAEWSRYAAGDHSRTPNRDRAVKYGLAVIVRCPYTG